MASIASRLKSLDCTVPGDVLRGLVAFEDEFNLDIEAFRKALLDFRDNELPSIDAEYDRQLEARRDLITGSPVPELGSFAEIERSTQLTSLERGGIGPLSDSPRNSGTGYDGDVGATEVTAEEEETSRIDERKLGAAGIALIRGRMFKIETGTRAEGFRKLWKSVNSEYLSWIGMANSITRGIPEGDFVFLLTNPETKRFPFVNKSLEEAEQLSGADKSVFLRHVFFNARINPTAANYNKLRAFGLSEDQANNIMSGKDPNGDDIQQTVINGLTVITNLIRELTALVLLAADDPLRQPRWSMEVDLMKAAISSFINLRAELNSASVILTSDYFDELRVYMSEGELTELFDFRPELLDILPNSSEAIIMALVQKALSLELGSTVINTYQISIKKYEDNFTQIKEALFDVGLSIWKAIQGTGGDTYAISLEAALRRLLGRDLSLTLSYPFFNNKIDINEKFLAKITPTSAQEAVTKTNAQVVSTAATKLGTSDGVSPTQFYQPPAVTPDLASSTTTLIAALNDGDPNSSIPSWYIQRSCIQVNGILTKELTNRINSVGRKLGLKTRESFGTLLARKWKPAKQFLDCMGSLEENIKGFGGSEGVGKATTIRDETGKEIGSSTNIKDAAANLKPNDKVVMDSKRGLVVQSLDSNKISNSQGSPSVKKETDDYLKNRAKVDQRQVTQSQGGSPNSYSGKLDLKFDRKCFDKLDKQIQDMLNRLDPFSKFTLDKLGVDFWKNKLYLLIQQIRAVLGFVQDALDSVIALFQLILDGALAKLERFLTFDFNFGGDIGLDNSLIKCSWGFDFGIKLDLLGILLRLMAPFFENIGASIRGALDFIIDFIERAVCKAIKFVEDMLNPVAGFLALLGCQLKDPQLPTEILELLELFHASLELRSIILRKGSDHWLELTGNLRNGGKNWNGLTQFAALCQSVAARELANALKEKAQKAVSSIPTAASKSATSKAAAAALGAPVG